LVIGLFHFAITRMFMAIVPLLSSV